MSDYLPILVMSALVIAFVLLSSALWVFGLFHLRHGDEALCDKLMRTQRFCDRLYDVEARLPPGVVRFFGLFALEMRYREKADADRRSLIASGYLVELPIGVTNLAGHHRPIMTRFKVFGATN